MKYMKKGLTPPALREDIASGRLPRFHVLWSSVEKYSAFRESLKVAQKVKTAEETRLLLRWHNLSLWVDGQDVVPDPRSRETVIQARLGHKSWREAKLVHTESQRRMSSFDISAICGVQYPEYAQSRAPPRWEENRFLRVKDRYRPKVMSLAMKKHLWPDWPLAGFFDFKRPLVLVEHVSDPIWRTYVSGSQIPVDAWWDDYNDIKACLLYTSPSPRDGLLSRMPSSA